MTKKRKTYALNILKLRMILLLKNQERVLMVYGDVFGMLILLVIFAMVRKK
jgi:hypothetical protein